MKFTQPNYTINRTLILSNSIIKNEFLDNINGPCCIRVPKFVNNSPGKYLLYFAHHSGEFIRLAYSNLLFQDWRILDTQICPVNEAVDFYDHVASPEVHINENEKKIYLFFHSRQIGSRFQCTFLATSKNGITFSSKIINSTLPFYMRFFQYDKCAYAITKGGNLYQNSGGGATGSWNSLGNIDTGQSNREVMHNRPGSIRHLAIINYKEHVFVFYSRIGDAPERIYTSNLFMFSELPRLAHEMEILRPIYKFEGSECKLEGSAPGQSIKFENAVRDPYVFEEEGKYYLFYTIGGESGIAICELNMEAIYTNLLQ